MPLTDEDNQPTRVSKCCGVPTYMSDPHRCAMEMVPHCSKCGKPCTEVDHELDPAFQASIDAVVSPMHVCDKCTHKVSMRPSNCPRDGCDGVLRQVGGNMPASAPRTRHWGDCTIYAALCNQQPTDGICTCGYGWDYLGRNNGDWKHMYSEERLAAIGLPVDWPGGGGAEVEPNLNAHICGHPDAMCDGDCMNPPDQPSGGGAEKIVIILNPHGISDGDPPTSPDEVRRNIEIADDNNAPVSIRKVTIMAILDQLTALTAERDRLRDALRKRDDEVPYWLLHTVCEFMSKLGCETGSDCSESGECVTEWCAACVAKAWMLDNETRRALSDSEQGETDGN